MKERKVKYLTRYAKAVSLLNVFQSVHDLTLHNKVDPDSIAHAFLDDKRLFLQLR